MEKYTIEIAVDSREAEGFCAWLNANGHDAQVGTSTVSYIDGWLTSHDEEMSSLMRELWAGYCNS